MFENKTVGEIASMLEADPELKEIAKLTTKLFNLFKQLPAERQDEAVEGLKEKYPEIAEALRKIKSPTSGATLTGQATN